MKDRNGAYTESLQNTVVYQVRSTLLVLMGRSGICFAHRVRNVANLSFARSLVRQQEYRAFTNTDCGL